MLLFVHRLIAGLGGDEVRMNETPSARLDREGVAALAHMEEALHLLDGCGDTLDIGVHLDLAICRLRLLMERNSISVAARKPPNS